MSSTGDNRASANAQPAQQCSLASCSASAERGEEADRLLREATKLFSQNQDEDAVQACKASVALRPYDAESIHLLGVLSYRKQEYAVAARWLRRAIALSRKTAHYHSNLGGALQAMGKLDEAALRYRRAVALRPLFAEAHFNLGNLLRTQGKQGAAIEAYGRAIAAQPTLHEAHTNLGNILQAIGEWKGADACYARALSIQPASAEAHSNRGNLRRAEGRLDEAVEQYQLALHCDPDFADAHTNMGTVLNQLGKLEEAIACHEKALALRPSFAEAHHNLGCVLQAEGLTELAIGRYQRAITLKPDYANAHFGKSLIHLLRAQYAEGWKGYEWRWQSDQHSTRWRDAEQPVWAGERLSSGQLLLWGEQGIGDEILFAGLVADAVATGNDCVLECDARLVPLFDRSFPKVKVVAAHAADCKTISAHLPSGSLPRLFRPDTLSFVATAFRYLFADPIAVAQLRETYRDRRHVIGVAWHTSNAKSGRRRSIHLSLLALLFTRTDVRWISLQYGGHEAIEQEAATAGAPMLVDRSVDQLINMDRFAAQVSAMDMVITIDNSTAHLAGALGVPVWVLLPFAPDWRWLEQGEGCAWYPSMRLFRQPGPGDWLAVVRDVDQQLDRIEHTALSGALYLPDVQSVQQRWSLAPT